LDQETFKQKIGNGIKKLNREQVAHFAWLCAVRALPFLGSRGSFDFWNENDRQKHLYSIFYALDVSAAAHTEFAHLAAEAVTTAYYSYSSVAAVAATRDAYSRIAAARVAAAGYDSARAAVATVRDAAYNGTNISASATAIAIAIDENFNIDFK